jgi:ribosome-binding protein aMBF1 (putative translation factor)
MKLIMGISRTKTTKQFELGVRNFAAWQDLMDELVAARESQGISQKEMGDRMGISQSAVAQFELSSANPTISSIIRYANQLGIELVLSTK